MVTDTSQKEVQLEVQCVEESETKTQSCQRDSAYGSLESSSNGQSQKSFSGSGSGSKSLHSGSSHSSGFGDQTKFIGIRLHDAKHLSVRKKTAVDKLAKSVLCASLPFSQDGLKDTPETVHKSQENETNVSLSKEETNILDIPTCISSLSSPTESCCGGDKEKNQTSLVYTQALNYIRKIKERSAEQGVPFASPYLENLTSERQVISDLFKSFISSRGFIVAISIQDGSVLHVSSSITDILGFPKDMLLGQSFIDFVYPKDTINFSSKIINGLNVPFRNNSIKDDYGTPFFCRLRKYHGLKTAGFGVRNKKTMYKPCKIIFKSQDSTRFSESLNGDSFQFSLIIAEVIPIETAYRDGEECSLGSFSIRHSASCNFSEYDPEAIPYLGHLPQDLTGNSIFECYHPEDMKKLKKIYEEIVHHQGKPYRSEPYRFRTFNNSWVTLMTEWLCFVNPWTKRIESIIGQHRVLKPPKDIDVFVDPAEKSLSPLPEEILIDAQTAQNEIIALLTKPVTSYQDPCKEPMVKRRRTLADFMSPFVEEMDNIEKKNSTYSGQNNPINHPSNCTKKSVVVSITIDPPTNPGTQIHKNATRHGQSEITHGQESLNSSVETPSSYGQLNYSATLQRFFCSNPKTMSSDESGESKMETSPQESIGFSTSDSANCKSQSQSQSQSGSGSGSGDNNCDSNSFRKSAASKLKFNKENGPCLASSIANQRYMLPLTEEILSKHNQNMQKQFMDCQNKRERAIKNNKFDTKGKSLKKLSKRTRERSYGLKRSSGTKGECEGNGPQKPTLLNSSTEYSTEFNKPSVFNTVKNSASGNGCLKLDRTYHAPLPPRPSLELSEGRNINIESSSSFQRLMPSYYIHTTNQSTASTSKETLAHPTLPSGYMPGVTSPFTAPPLMMNTQPTFYQSPTLPVHYVGGISGVYYQPIGPPLFNSPPVMLPNLVYQHTLIQPSMNHISVPVMSNERQYGGESEQDFNEPSHLLNKNNHTDKQLSTLCRPDSQATSVKAEPGSVRGSNASASCKVNAAESIRSYVDDLSLLPNITHSKQDRSQTPNFSQVSPFSQSTSVIAEHESIRSPEKHENKIIEDIEIRNYNSSDMIMSLDSSSSSPHYDKSPINSPHPAMRDQEDIYLESSFSNMKRETNDKPVLSEPPWIKDIKVTPELLLRYQLKTNELVDVLRQDMDLLKKTKQPSCVDDQLASLYCEMELEGESPELYLEEGITTSSSSDDQQIFNVRHHHSKKEGKRKANFYSKMSMLHEEEAPMPASDDLASSST